ncbi:trafficking protein particle complex subunit 14-like isoform X5 [Phyllopteryx taeniolatus]|uniref:trafficking protein particle complex subunit 14-like isoform X5 n=1 Tax=Phyllopteryx taeniolatus TaxID=161469 RepID=UPI002AD47A19|nr:trafficking protein particle complex subunit 14-like isoform X5 [Phyllopteryx taeniolatus]
MVQMMESQCEYFMYFPAVPITDLSEPARYRTLPRRSHLYLGETVRFLLVLRCRDAGRATPTEPGPGDGHGVEGGGGASGGAGLGLPERPAAARAVAHLQTRPEHLQGSSEHHLDRPAASRRALQADERLGAPPGRAESAEQVVPGGGEREGRSHSAGPQRLLPSRDARRLRAAGGQRLVRMLSALVTTRKSQSGSPRTITRGSEKSETCGVNGRATRRSHRSGEVGMASFCKVDSVACRLPSTLGALEEHDFLFRLHLNDMPQDESNEGMEVPLVAALQWSTPKMPFTNCIYTHYRLPSVRLDRPRFVMTASCPGAVKVKEHFKVKYVLLNNLQDFLSVRLVWTPEGRGQSEDAALSAVVCRTPLSNLGQCRKGCTLTFSVAFQILRPGLYELSQHMKLKLQFTASVSNPPPDARPLSRKNSPSSPAMRDLLDRHQASLGRSQSFSHQQPSRSHIMRTKAFCRWTRSPSGSVKFWWWIRDARGTSRTAGATLKTPARSSEKDVESPCKSIASKVEWST